MKVFLLVICIACGGCAKRMSNDEIIKESKKCTDAGLAAEYGRDASGRIIDVQCGPKGKP